jgi:hypothetical protein
MLSDDAESESSPPRDVPNPYFSNVIRKKPNVQGPSSGSSTTKHLPAAAQSAVPSFVTNLDAAAFPDSSVTVTAADVESAENELRVANSALATERRLKLKLRDQLSHLVDAAASTDKELASLETRIVAATATTTGPNGQQPRSEGELLVAIMELDDAARSLEREYAEVTNVLNVHLGIGVAAGRGLRAVPARRNNMRENLQRQSTKIRIGDQSKKAAMLQKQVNDMEARNRILTDQIGIMKNGKPTAAAPQPVSCVNTEQERGELAQLHDVIARESRSVHQKFASVEQEAAQRTNQKRLELNTAEHSRLANESLRNELTNAIENVSKMLVQSTQRKGDLQKDFEMTVNQIAAVKAEHARLDEALELCSNEINQILLRSSEVPLLQERAWQQEKAQLEAKVTSSSQAVQLLRKEKDSLSEELKTLTAQVKLEAELMKEMRELRCSVDDIKARREASAKEHSGKMLEATGTGGPSQKLSVIRSLDQSIAALDRQVTNTKESNESLRRKIKGLQALLVANGLGNM